VFLALSLAISSSGDGAAIYPALDAPATPERVLMRAMKLGVSAV